MKRAVFLKRGAGLAGAALVGAGLFNLVLNAPHRWPSPDARRRGVLRPPGSLAEAAFPAAARMGVAVVDERLCVSHNGIGVCGACHTACPLKGAAIVQGPRNRPTVKEACVGCGLCEEACIVDDPKAGRAIRVRSERRWA